MSAIPPTRSSRLRMVDLLITSTVAFRTRPVRAVLSALGIAIGISALIAIVGITGSNRAALLAQIDQLGTNILTVTDAGSAQGQTSTLPRSAAAMIARIPGAHDVSPTAILPNIGVYRTDQIPATHTAGLSVLAVTPTLLRTLGAATATGTFLTPTTSTYPVAVLGSSAATTLGITTLTADTRIWIGGHWFSVIGIDAPIPLAPALDHAALIGGTPAESLFGYGHHASTIYIRTDVARTTAVGALLARTAYPQEPSDVLTRQPTAALAARAAAVGASTALLVGLVAITLTVAGIGIANVMIIAVIERRHEIGIRRALGARRAHIRRQFLTEAVLLSAAGATTGAILGTAVSTAVAKSRGWPLLIPATTVIGGISLAILVGAIAGLLPAIRAARQTPTQALRS